MGIHCRQGVGYILRSMVVVVAVHPDCAVGRTDVAQSRILMTIGQLIQQLRHLVLEHPHAADVPIVIHPHGFTHSQELESVHLNLHQTRVVLEAERK